MSAHFMAFQHTIVARFFEIDRAGVVFFGRFFEYSHAAMEEMLEVATGGYDAALRQNDWGFPVVHTDADYARPVNMGERIHISFDIERRGRSSLTFLFILRGDDDLDRARIRQVHVCVDKESREARPWPEPFLAALQRAGMSLPEITK